MIIIITWIYKAQQIHESAQGTVQNKLTLYYLQRYLQINYLIYKYNLIYKKIKHQQKGNKAKTIRQKPLSWDEFFWEDTLKCASERLFLISAHGLRRRDILCRQISKWFKNSKQQFVLYTVTNRQPM